MANKDTVLSIRLTASQKAAVEYVTKTLGYTPSDWCRSWIMKEIIRLYNELITSEK